MKTRQATKPTVMLSGSCLHLGPSTNTNTACSTPSNQWQHCTGGSDGGRNQVRSNSYRQAECTHMHTDISSSASGKVQMMPDIHMKKHTSLRSRAQLPGSLGGVLISDGPSEQEDVWLWRVHHVVYPALALLHAYTSPLVLRH